MRLEAEVIVFLESSNWLPNFASKTIDSMQNLFDEDL